MPWGFRELDALTGGIHQAQMSVVAARTSEGKSVFVMQAAMSVARYLLANDLPGQVMIFSPEMQGDQLLMRYLQQRTGITAERVNRGELDPDELDLWLRACQRLREYSERITIRAQGVLDVRDLLADVESVHMLDPENPVRLVVVDYIQYLSGGGGSRYEQITDVAKMLKELNNKTSIPILAAAQIHKAGKDRNGKKLEDDAPSMDDISDSQYIARVADNVIVLWRPETKWGGRKAWVQLAKQRNGGKGTFFLGYDPETTKFYDDEFQT